MRTLQVIIVTTVAVLILYGINYMAQPKPKFREQQKVAVKILNGDPGTVLSYDSEREIYTVEYYDALWIKHDTLCRDSDMVAFADDSTIIR